MWVVRAKDIMTKGLALVGLGTVATKVTDAKDDTIKLITIAGGVILAILIFRR